MFVLVLWDLYPEFHRFFVSENVNTFAWGSKAPNPRSIFPHFWGEVNGPSSTKLHLFLHWNKKSNSCIGCGFQPCFAVPCLHLFPASVACLTDKNKPRITELPLEQPDSVSCTRGQIKCACLAFPDVMQVEVNPGQDQAETSTGFLCCWCQSWCCPDEGGGAGRVTGHGRKTGWDLDVKGRGYCLLSDGRGLRNYCRIPAVLVQDQLLKVSNACS